MTIHGSSALTLITSKACCKNLVLAGFTCTQNLLCHYQQTSGKLLVPPWDQEPLDQEPSWTSEFPETETGSTVEVEISI